MNTRLRPIALAAIFALLAPATSPQVLARIKGKIEVPNGTVVLVNCQLGGGADEGQPGFTLVLLKAVIVHQWVQSAGLD
jgi:hypothetical protein